MPINYGPEPGICHMDRFTSPPVALIPRFGHTPPEHSTRGEESTMSRVFQARFRPLPVLVVLAAAMSVSCSESGPGPDAGTPPAREAAEPAAKLAVDDIVLADLTIGGEPIKAPPQAP